MTTFEERKAYLIGLSRDLGSEFAVKEAIQLCYHWYQYEMARKRRSMANRAIKKYGTKLNEAIDKAEKKRRHLKVV